MYTLRIEHCSDQDFLVRFGRDLASAARQVIILSPFLSNNRAFHYYPVFMSLTSRNVKVDVYSKPQKEQPESLRQHFWEVQNGLERAGVSLHTRPGMHEKIAFVDNHVLWHGSLNILSHNDTRESMLRFESSALIEEVLAELQLAKGMVGHPSYDEAPADAFPESPPCPICSGKMVPFADAGIWICEISPECKGTSLMTARSERPKSFARVKISCPLCGAPMEISRGVFLRVACSSQECGFSLDPRIASSLLRVLKKRGVA